MWCRNNKNSFETIFRQTGAEPPKNSIMQNLVELEILSCKDYAEEFGKTSCHVKMNKLIDAFKNINCTFFKPANTLESGTRSFAHSRKIKSLR